MLNDHLGVCDIFYIVFACLMFFWGLSKMAFHSLALVHVRTFVIVFDKCWDLCMRWFMYMMALDDAI